MTTKGGSLNLRDVAREAAEAAVLGLVGELDADGALGAGGILEYDAPGFVLFVVAQLGVEALLLERFEDGL